MSQPRRVVPGQTVMVTRRTLWRYFLLRPDSVLNQVFLYLIAFYAQKFSMAIAAIQVLSDHYHMVFVDQLGKLPRFLRELNRVLALCVKVLRGWDGPVWEPGAVSVVAITTPQAAAEEMVYTWLNAVQAGLVEHAHEWPGVTTSLDDLDGPAIIVKRPEVYLNAKSGKWPEQIELRLTMPPILAELGPERARQMLRDELERQLGEIKSERREQGRKVLGAQRCLQASPRDRATSREPLRSRNPVLAAGRGCHEVLQREIKALQEFRRSYREALKRWCEGIRDVLFPYGTWWMVKHHGAREALPEPVG